MEEDVIQEVSQIEDTEGVKIQDCPGICYAIILCYYTMRRGEDKDIKEDEDIQEVSKMKNMNGEELVQVMPENVNNQEACSKNTDDDIYYQSEIIHTLILIIKPYIS